MAERSLRFMIPLPLRVALTRVGEPTPAQYLAARTPMNHPPEVLKFWNEVVAVDPAFESDKEHLVVVMLNVRMFPIGFNLVSVGSLCESVAHPREILRPCVVMAAYGFILAHNHPSGDPSPSEADRRLTRRINDAAYLLQMRFIDHIVVGNSLTNPPGYCSFKEMRLL